MLRRSIKSNQKSKKKGTLENFDCTDPDSKVFITVPHKGLQSTKNIAQISESLVSRSIITCLCTPAKFYRL